MKINPNNVDIIISAVESKQYPETGLPEIALSGRSNVGKSTFINTLISRRKVARTSSKPCKTQTLNFFNIDEQLIFVDVPGYGYAKVSKKQREQFGKMIEQYLTTRKELKCVIQLIDIRHKPTQDDILMYDYLKHFEIPTIIVATKEDKIPKGKVQKHLKIIRETLEIESEDVLISYSSLNKDKTDNIWALLSQFI